MKLQLTTFLILSLIITNQSFGSHKNEVCPTPVPKQYRHLKSGNVVSAYFGNWDVYGKNSYQINEIEAIAGQLTHLVYGFMKPDDIDFECKPHDVWADVGAYNGFQSKVGGSFAKLIDLKKKFPHLKIMLSIGGGKYNKKFINIAQNSDNLLKFARSCVDMLDFYNHPFLIDGKYKRVNHLTYEGLFDGIDIDWEWDTRTLTPELSQAFTKFIEEISRLLHLRKKSTGQDSLFTIALPVVPGVYKNLDLKRIMKNVDWFNLMTYDFFGPWSEKVGFNAPLCSSESIYSVNGAVQRIMEQGVSPEKMVLGLPLYGYLYENSDGHKTVIDKKNKIKTISYNLIVQKYLHNPAYEKVWNSYGKVPSLYSKQDRIFISYDGQESIAEKVELAKNKRMQGVVLWRLSGDDAQHSMVRAIVNVMKK